MLCNDFEERLTDYLDGVLEPNVHKTFAEHALRCPVCHETLSEVKNTMQACQRCKRALEAPRDLEARILLSTMPETAMTCEDFEESLTDYLDGFLPALALSSLGTSRCSLRSLHRASGRSRARDRHLLHLHRRGETTAGGSA